MYQKDVVLVNTYKISDISDKIRLLGRSGIIGECMVMDMTLSGYEFCADFSSSLMLSYAVGFGTAKLGVVIDGDYDSIHMFDLHFNEKAFGTISVPIENGRHTVRVLKLSEYQFGGLVIKDMSFDGSFSETPTAPKLKFEFYGDSLTCGYGNMSENRNTPKNRAAVENSTRTYCSLISRKYNADISVASASGFGIVLSCDGLTHRTYKAFYSMLSPIREINWDFERYVADVVFINLGTNDKEFCRNNPGKIVSYDDLHDHLHSFISDIRKHNPNCCLIFVSGVSGDMKQDGQIDVDAVYENLVKEFDRAYFIDKMYTKQLGGDWHPNIDDHKDLADRLIVKLHTAIPEIF